MGANLQFGRMLGSGTKDQVGGLAGMVGYQCSVSGGRRAAGKQCSLRSTTPGSILNQERKPCVLMPSWLACAAFSSGACHLVLEQSAVAQTIRLQEVVATAKISMHKPSIRPHPFLYSFP